MGKSMWSAPLDLSSLGLQHVAPKPLLAAICVRVLVVEDNELSDLGPILLLHSLEELRAARNKLVGEATVAFSLPRLRQLDVSKNQLALGGVAAALAPPPSLEGVDLSGNPAVLRLLQEGASTGIGSPILERLFAADAGTDDRWAVEVDAATGQCSCRAKVAMEAPSDRV